MKYNIIVFHFLVVTGNFISIKAVDQSFKKITLRNKSNKNIMYVIQGDEACSKKPFSDVEPYTIADSHETYYRRGFAQLIPLTLQKNVIVRGFLDSPNIGKSIAYFTSFGSLYHTSKTFSNGLVKEACSQNQNQFFLYIGYPLQGKFKQGDNVMTGPKPENVQWYKAVLNTNKFNKKTVDFYTPGSNDFKKQALFVPWQDEEKAIRDQKDKERQDFINAILTAVETFNKDQLDTLLKQSENLDKDILTQARNKTLNLINALNMNIIEEQAKKQPNQSVIKSLQNKLSTLTEIGAGIVNRLNKLDAKQ